MTPIGRTLCGECICDVTPLIEARTETLAVRGEPVQIESRVAVCPECGNDMCVPELDDVTLVAAYDIYRARHDLMLPDEMVALRRGYGLSQRAFSLLLGWGEITLHRYEGGSLQDAAHEATLRMAEDPANVRVLLARNGHRLTARQRTKLEGCLAATEDASRPAVSEPGYTDAFLVREEVDEYAGWRPMELSKVREMMVFFAGLPEMFTTKLNKLLFYADFTHYRDHGASISGAAYLAMQRGPVPIHYDRVRADLIEGGDLGVEEIDFPSGASGETVSRLRDFDEDLFSKTELATLTMVARRLGRVSSTRLSELSHEEDAWKATPQGELISYATAKTLRR